MGTRFHKLALFVVVDNPMQIFSGNPSQGYQEPDFMNNPGSIPAGWDETVIPVHMAPDGGFLLTLKKN